MADFYADQNISLDLIALLHGRGHTAVTARDLGLERARDDETSSWPPNAAGCS